MQALLAVGQSFRRATVQSLMESSSLQLSNKVARLAQDTRTGEEEEAFSDNILKSREGKLHHSGLPEHLIRVLHECLADGNKKNIFRVQLQSSNAHILQMMQFYVKE
jgi:hypothetical protein